MFGRGLKEVQQNISQGKLLSKCKDHIFPSIKNDRRANLPFNKKVQKTKSSHQGKSNSKTRSGGRASRVKILHLPSPLQKICPIIVKIFSKVALKLSFLHETSKFKSKIRVFWYSTQIHHYCYVHTTSHKVIHSHQISLYLALASSNEISFI